MDKNKIAVKTYDKIAARYFKQYSGDTSDFSFVDNFLALLPKYSKILDIGSGPGIFARYIKSKGFQVSGIDLSTEMIKIAQEQVPDVNFYPMDLRVMSFPDNSFDALLSAYSLIHIPTEQIPLALREFHRVVRTSGYILIIAPSGEQDKIVDEPLLPSEKMFFNLLTRERIAKFLEDSNFELISQEEAPNPDQNPISKTIVYTIAQAV